MGGDCLGRIARDYMIYDLGKEAWLEILLTGRDYGTTRWRLSIWGLGISNISTCLPSFDPGSRRRNRGYENPSSFMRK
jgi:hypothetical protein